MKLYKVSILILFTIIIICTSCTVIHRTTKAEQIYLIGINQCLGGISVKESILPTIKLRAIDYINTYSNMKLIIVSDSLISTKGNDGKSIIKNEDKYKIGYIIKIKQRPDGMFAISVKCYTNVIYKNKKEKNKYEYMFVENRLICLNYLATNEVMPKFIDNPKYYDEAGPLEAGDIRLD